MLAEQRAHLRELRFKTANDQLKNVRDIRVTRKGIAQILMLISEKARGEATKETAAAQTKNEETNK